MLYIANTTKQNWNHHFRVIESNRPFYVQIPSGSQVEVGRNWSAAQTESVVRQLEKFGGRPVNDLSRNLERFPGILYRVDKAITEDQIRAGHEAVVDDQQRRAASETVRSAKGFDVANRDKRTKKRLARVTEVEVHQDSPRHEKPSGSEVHFKMGVADDGASDDRLIG